MAEQRPIKYAPQWTNMTVDNVIFQTNNVVGSRMNYSSTEQVNSIQQLLAYNLITGTEVDIGEIIYSDLDPSKVTDIELTAHMIAVNNRRDSMSLPPLAAKPKKGNLLVGTIPDPQDLERDIQLASTGLPSTHDEGTHKSQPLSESTATHPKDSEGNKQPLDRDITSTTPVTARYKTRQSEGSLGHKDSGGNIPPADMEPIHTPVADPSGTGEVDETQSTRLRYRSMTKNEGKTSSELEPNTEHLQLQTFADIQAFLLSEDELDKESDEEEVLAAGDDMDEDPQDNAEKLPWLDKRSTTISDLYKGLNVITELLKGINNVVKDDLATNKKIYEAIKTFAKISTQTIEILSLVKTFDFSTLHATMQDLQAHALKQEEVSASWTKSSINMAWNLGSRITAVEISQTALKRSVTPTLSLTYIPAIVEGENATTTATDEPPSHTEGEIGDTTMEIPISSSNNSL
ncbi:hypothetical protein Tco_1371357 [Tanacetum coccineum]